MELLDNKQIPESMLQIFNEDSFSRVEADIEAMKARAKVTRQYGMWAFVDKRWTKELANWIGNRECLEVMAGAGWLAKALNEHGVDIIASDNYELKHGYRYNCVFPIEKLNALNAVKKYHNKEILIMSWPPYDNNIAYKVIKKWGDKKPIIFIGENRNGCCANNKFFDHFKYEIKINIPQWKNIHDSVYIGHYVKNNT